VQRTHRTRKDDPGGVGLNLQLLEIKRTGNSHLTLFSKYDNKEMQGMLPDQKEKKTV
jgi:hypothetical protein